MTHDRGTEGGSSELNAERQQSLVPPITVLIIDDHPMVAEGLAAALETHHGISVIGIERNCAAGLAAAARLNPDLVLLEQRLPDGLGTGLLPTLFAHQPGVKVLVVTADDSDEVLAQAFRAGAAGVISKKNRVAVLITAIRATANGEPVITPDTLRRLLPYLASAGSRVGADLTDRERDVLRLLVEGTSTASLAARLFVAPATARNHIQSVITKLGAHSRLEAVSIALRENILATVV
ncbi:MAG: response regulator transcription factor [Nakamurella sp.]